MNLPKYLEEDYYQKIKRLNIRHYAAEVSYYLRAELRPVEKAILSQLRHRSTLLDLGCGAGRFSIGASQQGFKITGVDITPEAVGAAKKRLTRLKLKNADFQVGDMTNLQFKNSSFDDVLCPRFSINAVATFTRRKKAVKEMLRVVKPGGKVYIESFNRFYLGMGLHVPIRNMTIDILRKLKIQLCSLVGKKYEGLLPGDMIYPANKVKGAPEGYAHIPTIFELKRLIPKGVNYKIYSIPEILTDKKLDLLKWFRYSLWLILYKK